MKKKPIKACFLDKNNFSKEFHEISHRVIYLISEFAQTTTKFGEETINCIMEMVLFSTKHLFIDIYMNIEILQANEEMMEIFVRNFSKKVEEELIELLKSTEVKNILTEHYKKQNDGAFH